MTPKVYLCKRPKKSPGGKTTYYWTLKFSDSKGRTRWRSVGAVGKVSKRQAEAARRELLVGLGSGKVSPSRPQRITLDEFRTEYVKRRRRGDEQRGYLRGAPRLKAGTIREHDMALRYLAEHFGGDYQLAAIDESEAEAFIEALAAGKLEGARKATKRKWGQLSDQRIRGLIRALKAACNWAHRFGIVNANPFDRFDGTSRPGRENPYVPLPDFIRLLRACRNGDGKIDHRARALYGLCRLAGLRRGEALALPWSGKEIDSDGHEHLVGVDFELRRLNLVGNAKTQRKYRQVPICPRLYRILVRAFDAAEDGQETVCGLSPNNLHRMAERHVAAAGLKRWRKPYQAMRSSCENDWKVRGISEVTYCAWAGHDPGVSRKHYVCPVESEYEQVIRPRRAASES